MRSLISAVASAAVLGLACVCAAPGGLAQESQDDQGVSRNNFAARAQATPKLKRAPTRLRVTPRISRCFYRTETLDHPPPYDCEFPGPGFVRQCTARLVQEYRPSGMVIVPVTRCWWERG